MDTVILDQKEREVYRGSRQGAEEFVKNGNWEVETWNGSTYKIVRRKTRPVRE